MQLLGINFNHDDKVFTEESWRGRDSDRDPGRLLHCITGGHNIQSDLRNLTRATDRQRERGGSANPLRLRLEFALSQRSHV